MGGSNCSTCEVSENRGCGVSSVFDWLYQIDSPLPHKYIEVQFKGDRKDFYVNNQKVKLSKGDFVTVEAEKSGHDVGKITMTGELVELQMKRKNRDILILFILFSLVFALFHHSFAVNRSNSIVK